MADASGSETPAPKWKTLSGYSAVSDCGRYMIAKVFVGEQAIYVVWTRGAHGGLMELKQTNRDGSIASVWTMMAKLNSIREAMDWCAGDKKNPAT